MRSTDRQCPTCHHSDLPDRLPTADAARYCGLAESTLRYYRHANTGPASYSIGSKVYYDRVDLDDWLAAQRAASLRGGVK
jgi:hypothetical protein